jgi:hypothetical protein
MVAGHLLDTNFKSPYPIIYSGKANGIRKNRGLLFLPHCILPGKVYQCYFVYLSQMEIMPANDNVRHDTR